MLYLLLLFMLLFPAQALADPVTDTIAAIAVISTTTAEAAIIVYDALLFLTWTAASIGLSYVSRLIAGKPNVTNTGTKLQLAAGGDVPRSFIIGNWAVGGSEVYAGSWTVVGNSQNNTMLVYVVALSDLPIDSLTGIIVNGKRCVYNTGLATYSGVDGYSIQEFEFGKEQYLWVKFYDGTQTTANSYMIDKFSADPDYPWDSSFVGYGMAYAIVTIRLSQGLFPGMPKFIFECKGVKLYDQRLDSTAGGSGSQRFATPSTWAFSENPIVGIHNILRGVSYNSVWMYGLQNTSPGRTPSGSLFAAATECDVLIADADGNSNRSYRWGAEVLLNSPPIDVVNAALQSCNGRMAEIGGLYKFSVGASGSAVYTFTDGDIIIDAPQQFDQFPSRSDVVNGIAAVFPSPAESWQNKEAPLLEDASFRAQDGGQFIADVNYTNVWDMGQVQRLQQSALNEKRKFRRHSHVLPPSAWALEPNDVINWTSTKNGYSSKSFRINQISDTYNLDIPVSISECDPADYDFNPVTDYLDFTNIPIASVPTTYAPPDQQLALNQVIANLASVKRLLDHYGEIAISQNYKTESVLPGLVAGISARVTQEITLRADGDSALAELVDEAVAQANDATASALIRWVAAAGPAGVVARLALESRATTGDSFTQAGIYIDAMIIGAVLTSQITLDADYIWLKTSADRILLGDKGVTSGMLEDGAATNHSEMTYTGPSTASSAPSTFTTLASVSHVAEGAKITFSGSLFLKNADNSNHGASWRILRGATQIWPPSGLEDVMVLANQTFGVPIDFAETPSAGTYTYAIQWKSAHVNNQAFGVFCNIDELKK